MLNKIGTWLKSLWADKKGLIVSGIIGELNGTKPAVQAKIIAQLKASGQDLSKMSVGDAVNLILNTAYSEVEVIIRRQI